MIEWVCPTIDVLPQIKKAAQINAQQGNDMSAANLFLYRNKYAISLGLRSSCFYNDVFDINFDPNVSVNFVLKNDIACNVSMAIRTQYLHQTGFSSNGLPTEFWFASNDKMKE